MNSIFAAARQLGDEFVRVLDDLAAEDPCTPSASRAASMSQNQQQAGPGGRPKRPKEGPPMALVEALQAQLGVGVIALTNQNQLNILIQHFTAPITQQKVGSLHHFSSNQAGRGGSSNAAELDLNEERIFLFHLFLQLNYLHEADWVTSLSALVPLSSGGDGDITHRSSRGPQHFTSGGPMERCLKFPYVVVVPSPTTRNQPTQPSSSKPPSSSGNNKKSAVLPIVTGEGIPRELVVIKPSLAEDTMRRLYRWVAMFYQERALLEEKIQQLQFQRMQEQQQQQQQQQQRGVKSNSNTSAANSHSNPPAPKKKDWQPPSSRWSVGCSFKHHRNGAQHLVNGAPLGGGLGLGGFEEEEEEISGEDQEPQRFRTRLLEEEERQQQQQQQQHHVDSLPNESFTLTMMGEDVSHRHLLLTQCQRHRLFRDTTPQLLWASYESRYTLWDVLPSSGTRSPVVLVLQSQDLDVFGCILSSMPATRGDKREFDLGEGEMPFLSFFTFTPTFQFLDVEAPTMVPFDHDPTTEAPAQQQAPAPAVPKLPLGKVPPQPEGMGGAGGASPQQHYDHETQHDHGGIPPSQNTAAYFMSLGEGDPPSLGRLQSHSQQRLASHSQPGTPAKVQPHSHSQQQQQQRRESGGHQAQEEEQGDGIRREVSEVALSVDRRDEGGLTVCARFTVPQQQGGGGGGQQMMVVVLDIATSLSECRVAAKSASAELHSGFHFNVAGSNKLSTPTSTSGNTALPDNASSKRRAPSVDDLAILEDDRKSVPLRAVEVYHMEAIPASAQASPSPQQQPTTSSYHQGGGGTGTPQPKQQQQVQATTAANRANSACAPPFVIHPEDSPAGAGGGGGGGSSGSPTSDGWGDAEVVASPVAQNPRRIESEDEFLVIG